MVQRAEHDGPVRSEPIHLFVHEDCLFHSLTLTIKVGDVEEELFVVFQVQVEWADLSVRNGGIVDGDLHKVQQSTPVRRRRL